ncbi:hypothetical protein IQ264_25355 [Phormidium sp. LEGE 05292]|uniref:hypothetical protein n=1 Tax=[Phormidium] sp. LEGE 05292 TaxID=767427 RepID=UPI001880DC42|nr:hypothetical protein [Phormidium sp. LEGE 05292]MBE9228742.1 hypothetical protein [Phormidium sp. LEGE 05292]
MYHPSVSNISPIPSALAIQVDRANELPDALQKIGLQGTRPTLVIVGGASGLTPPYLTYLERLFEEKIAPLAEKLQAYVVDGGTDAGVMQLIGKARLKLGGTFPLIGVAAIGTVILPEIENTFADAAPLEPNHTHFVFVPGNKWGDESPWIADVATILANDAPSVTVLINGGAITLIDASHSIRVNRPLIVVAGSGRTADRIVAALQGEATDEQVKQVAQFDKLTAVELENDFHSIEQAIAQKLSFKESQ